MTERWNECIGVNDLVIHCGDFAGPQCRDPIPYLELLHGYIIIIKGNHDKMRILDKMPRWIPYMRATIGNHKCLFNHRPIYPNEMRNMAKDPYNDHDGAFRNQSDFDFVISGHIHNGYEEHDGKKIGRLWTGKSLNLSVELYNYTPIEEDKLVAILDARAKSYQQCTAKMIVPGDYASWLKVG